MPFLIFLVMILVIGICWLMYEDSDSGAPIWIAVAALLIGGGLLRADYVHTSERTIIVEGKDRGGDDGSYRIYTDSDTLAVKDIWFSSNARIDSADLYGDIKVCHMYRVAVRGWEFGLFSMMPNLDHIIEDLGPVEGCESRI